MHKKLQPKPLPPKTLTLKGISPRTIQEHYKLYQGYVNKANETREKLRALDVSKGNATYSDVRALKRGESYALDGVKLHELYFEQLTGAGGAPSGDLQKDILKTWGSYERFAAELKGAGLSARGWAILAYDTDQKELFIYITDDQHDGHVVQAIPLLPMDVFEHAYYIDYGTKRDDYIQTFLNNIDWSIINKRFARARRETSRFAIFGTR
ncbi:superoxide dismutase [Tumebacillus lipolyticus]|uniref:superoxide dismutase n=1 Tax=Tumebacillus lipolyticus TaxID=1280370 RepID=A0ABW5A1K8_9BACL